MTLETNQLNNKKNIKKIAILHAFFKHDCKGGGEKLIFEIRNYYNADLFAGGVAIEVWNPENAKTDSFVAELYNPKYNFDYLHTESLTRIWGKIKRQLYFAFSPKINLLKNYDIVIFSGNIGLVPQRLKKGAGKKPKLITYCHTPPRPFTDQLQTKIKGKNPIYQFLFKNFAKLVRWQYKKDLQQMDLIICNSKNTQKRLLDYIGLKSEVVFPAVNTQRFQFIKSGDYFISYARLEEIKRIKLIVNAFAQIPDKKLVICSTGPLKSWIKEQIETRNLTNITFEGLVSDQRLAELVGGCLAGIYIPVDEDAGITQCEIMSAGKPVIGVNEGGLIETIIDGKTGLMLPAKPTEKDLIQAVQKLTPSLALSMKDDCINQAKKFDTKVFFEKTDKLLFNDN
jgi:glycosyltransferase involved in cell wall biosynthesis